MTAPPPSALSTDNILEEMKKVSKNVLEKHLDCRKFNSEKVKILGDDIITEIYSILSKKYPQYGFCISFYMSDITTFLSDSQCIYYSETDLFFVVPFNTNEFYSEVRLFAAKKRNTLKNFLDNINNSELLMNINKKISNLLSDREFVYEPFQKLLNSLCLEINNLLLERKDRPCSYHIGFINKLPTKGIYFHYKFFNLEFLPVFFSYSNDSFNCRIYLFLLNN